MSSGTHAFNSNSFIANCKTEREANKFAVELLLPDEMISNNPETDIYKLSNMAGVPPNLFISKGKIYEVLLKIRKYNILNIKEGKMKKKKSLVMGLMLAGVLGLNVNASTFDNRKLDFIIFTPETYKQAWNYGKTIKKHGAPESPRHYGVEFRPGTIRNNQVTLMTPYTMTLFISSTEELRLLQIPSNLENTILSNQGILWIVPTFGTNGGITLGGGTVNHLAIIKDGIKIYPKYKLNESLKELLPTSNAAAYFGFDRETILNTPYEVRYINIAGDPVSFEVTTEYIYKIIEDEKKFQA